MIYDNPNHPHYGPVRRLHLKLMELFPDNLSEVEDEYLNGIGNDWTTITVMMLERGLSEAYVARYIISRLIGCFDTIFCRATCNEVSSRA